MFLLFFSSPRPLLPPLSFLFFPPCSLLPFLLLPHLVICNNTMQKSTIFKDSKISPFSPSPPSPAAPSPSTPSPASPSSPPPSSPGQPSLRWWWWWWWRWWWSWSPSPPSSSRQGRWPSRKEHEEASLIASPRIHFSIQDLTNFSMMLNINPFGRRCFAISAFRRPRWLCFILALSLLMFTSTSQTGLFHLLSSPALRGLPIANCPTRPIASGELPVAMQLFASTRQFSLSQRSTFKGVDFACKWLCIFLREKLKLDTYKYSLSQ